MSIQLRQTPEELLAGLAEREFEYKVLTAAGHGLQSAITTPVNGWVHIGHIRVLQKGASVHKVFLARLLPEGESTCRALKQFNMWHYLTYRLPKPLEMRVQAKERGWNLMIKRWRQFDPSVPNEVCVTFFGEVRGKSICKI